MLELMGDTASKKNTTATGNLGESIAAHYLQRHGYDLLERNYWKKWGEIDIVCQKEGRVHFVEVKAVSYETRAKLDYAVTHETWRPEELVHAFKQRQIHRAAETWISEHGYGGEVQIDVVTVRIVPRETLATVNLIENIVLEP